MRKEEGREGVVGEPASQSEVTGSRCHTGQNSCKPEAKRMSFFREDWTLAHGTAGWHCPGTS